MSTVLITFTTPNWRFVTLAHSEAAGRAALADGWAVHCAQTGADERYLDHYADDVNVLPMIVGTVYRDNEELPKVA